MSTSDVVEKKAMPLSDSSSKANTEAHKFMNAPTDIAHKKEEKTKISKIVTEDGGSKEKENADAGEIQVPKKGYDMSWMNDASAFPGGVLPSDSEKKTVETGAAPTPVQGTLAERIVHKVRALSPHNFRSQHIFSQRHRRRFI